MEEVMKAFEMPKTVEANKYYPQISNRKAVSGGVEGLLAGVIAVGLTAGIKMVMSDTSPEIENAIASVSGLAAGSIVVGITKFIRNRSKHIKK